MPNADDHRIYQWVRFDGKRQGWVAGQLGVSQATVSRVLQRYDRWKAHADPRDGGQLDQAERVRALRWLNFERHELIIASALRLAGEMEGFTDTSKTVTSHPLAHPTREGVVRHESGVIDRSGMVARFLRLAHRVMTDQQRFIEQEQPPVPEPLSADENAREAAEADQDRTEIRQSRRQAQDRLDKSTNWPPAVTSSNCRVSRSTWPFRRPSGRRKMRPRRKWRSPRRAAHGWQTPGSARVSRPRRNRRPKVSCLRPDHQGGRPAVAGGWHGRETVPQLGNRWVPLLACPAVASRALKSAPAQSSRHLLLCTPCINCIILAARISPQVKTPTCFTTKRPRGKIFVTPDA